MKTSILTASAALLLLAACGTADAADRGAAAPQPRAEKQRKPRPPVVRVRSSITVKDIEAARWHQANEEAPESLLPRNELAEVAEVEEVAELVIYRARPASAPTEAPPEVPAAVPNAEASEAAAKEADQPDPE